MADVGIERHDGEWFRELAEATGDIFFAFRTHPDFTVEFMSEGIAAHVGYTAAEFLADPGLLARMVDPRDAALLEQALALAPGQTQRLQYRCVHKDGSTVWSETVSRCRLRADGTHVLEGTSHNTTARHLAEQALATSERRHRLLAENAWDVIWTMAVDGTITYVSPAVERVRGITAEEAAAQTLDQNHPPESAARVGDYFQRLYGAMAAGEPPPTFFGEQEYFRKDGSIMTGELQVIPHVDEDGQVLEILGVTRDVSDRKRFEAELSRLAITDPLTGAWNRRHGEQLLGRDLAEAAASGQPLTLLMLDIDHFKAINDELGHQTGDRVLVAVVRRLTEGMRDTDVLVRWGGEEFVLLLRDCDEAAALAVAEKLRAVVAGEPVSRAGHVTVSMGVAQWIPGEALSEWMERADAAMYRAKAAGRNCVVSG